MTDVPTCSRCAQPILGPLAIGSAQLDDGRWVCGYDATAAEHQAHLRRELEAQE